MEKEIIIAIISGSAVILAAVITGVLQLINNRNKKASESISINQKSTGNNTNQIGIINNSKDGDENDK